MSMLEKTKIELTAEEIEQLEKEKTEAQELVDVTLKAKIQFKNVDIRQATMAINNAKEMRKDFFDKYGIKAMTPKRFKKVHKYNIDILYNRYVLRYSTKELKKLNNGKCEKCKPLQKRIKEIDNILTTER